jgi:hypothetical protein
VTCFTNSYRFYRWSEDYYLICIFGGPWGWGWDVPGCVFLESICDDREGLIWVKEVWVCLLLRVRLLFRACFKSSVMEPHI